MEASIVGSATMDRVPSNQANRPTVKNAIRNRMDMFGNELILGLDSLRSVEKLPNFNLCLHAGSFLRSGG